MRLHTKRSGERFWRMFSFAAYALMLCTWKAQQNGFGELVNVFVRHIHVRIIFCTFCSSVGNVHSICKVLKTCGMANRRTFLHCFDSAPKMWTQLNLALYERENSTSITTKKSRKIWLIYDNYFFDQKSLESLNAYISESCFHAKSNIRQFDVPPTNWHKSSNTKYKHQLGISWPSASPHSISIYFKLRHLYTRTLTWVAWKITFELRFHSWHYLIVWELRHWLKIMYTETYSNNNWSLEQNFVTHVEKTIGYYAIIDLPGRSLCPLEQVATWNIRFGGTESDWGHLLCRCFWVLLRLQLGPGKAKSTEILNTNGQLPCILS